MAEETKVLAEEKVETPVMTDSEKIDLLVKEIKSLKTEVFINRVIFAIALVIALLYAHFQVEHFGTILGTLLEMFMSA